MIVKHSKPTVDALTLKSVYDVLISGDHATEETVSRFEKKLSSFIDQEGGVATNSGTSALHIALLARGIKKGDEVIMPSFVCTALLNAVNYVGARAVLADIGEKTLGIDYKSAARRVTRKTKAVIIPHMFGCPVDVKPFLGLGVCVIEDCAQSLGAKKDGRMTGSKGHASIFSFYATKLISTGHGGMMTTNSKAVLQRARDLLRFDKRKDYKVRFNYNMTDFQAALGISQLDKLNEFIEKRISIAEYYTKRFACLPVKLPAAKDHIYYRYIVRIDKGPSSFIRHFKNKGIEAKMPVFKPLHRYLGLDKKDFPETEKAFKESISIPIYPDMDDSTKEKIADTLIEIFRRRKC